MPLYTHKCDKCGTVTEIQRSFDDYKDTPTKEEQSCQCEDTTWTKELGVFRVTKAPGFGKKAIGDVG